MSISLDTLLFWCGLALLCIGLFVFLTGRKASDESKKESNRFEAFGIKIDVNNPSLILVMLGVVMMLAPKFMPQEVKESKIAGLELEQPAEPASPREAASPPPGEPDKPALATADTTQPQQPNTEIPEATTAILPTDSQAPKVVEAPAPPRPAVSAPPQAPAPAVKQPTSPPAAQVKKTEPVAIKPDPEPVAAEPVNVAPEPPDALLMVAVVADVSERAGIRESANAYARRASETIAQRVGEIFSQGLEINQSTTEDLRDHLQKGAEDYASLCGKWQADILILGDLKIVTGWSTIDSAYWPDYHIHLYNCGTDRFRKEVFKHLNPTIRDRFPFEEAINEKTMKFLTDSRWVVDN